ncbi:DNA gyrase inhibitor YacG [Marivibrio halodurans]|uniref:DNA gyrase inhibitor YacG n=1 Tax=Marivibrio halodurans TaxID=2039722 RepID=A0A8J7RWJ6_9PROT|nr:DNA gyrase inhibitor YacG [Marivibrio halodurans]MBP5855830.1 DNA gyrase inhibitor YacG [Marivibrio halodurans]
MFDPDRKPRKRAGKARCPICREPVQEATKPFCSDRCRQVDLNRWLGEHYRIPTEEGTSSDEVDPDGGGPGRW